MNHWTIVIPAYNEEKRIEDTIQRAKNQITKYWYNIIVVDNWSNDKTKDIAHRQWVEVVDESMKWVKYARMKWIEAAKDLFNSRIILQLDADSKVSQNWIEEHMRQYEDENIWIVGWSIEWTERSLATATLINTVDLFKWRIISLAELKLKGHFEKRLSWLEQWVLPIPWTNMSYLTELWLIRETIIWWTWSLWEDYYKATKIYTNHQEINPDANFKLIDNNNIRVKTPSRWDHTLINFIKQKYKYKKSNTSKVIQTWELDWDNYQMTDYR